MQKQNDFVMNSIEFHSFRVKSFGIYDNFLHELLVDCWFRWIDVLEAFRGENSWRDNFIQGSQTIFTWPLNFSYWNSLAIAILSKQVNQIAKKSLLKRKKKLGKTPNWNFPFNFIQFFIRFSSLLKYK